MKKQLIMLQVGLILASTSLASIPLLPKALSNKLPKPLTKTVKTSEVEGYANFSGHWVGSCDQGPEEEEILDIKQDESASKIVINNVTTPIDAISFSINTQNLASDSNTQHLRWSKDGQQLLGTVFGYLATENLSQGNLINYIGKMTWSINDQQLLADYTVSIYNDGTLIDTASSHCVLKKG